MTILCHSIYAWRESPFSSRNKKRQAKRKKAEDCSLRFLLVPSPRYVAKLNSYCSGDTLVVQVPGAVVLTRITASASEQSSDAPSGSESMARR